MEQMAESHRSKRIRISWKNRNVVKTFLEACIHEVAINKKEGGSLKALSWKKIAETLKTVHNFEVNRKQMRNHFDYLKGKYRAWLKLKNKAGYMYDPSTNSFNLTPAQWEMEIQSSRYVESLRTTSLPFPELCEQLFEGGGNGSFEPISNHSNDLEPSTEPLYLCNKEEVEISESQSTSSIPASSSHSQVRKNKRKRNQSCSNIDEEMLNVLKALVVILGNHNRVEAPTYSACLQKLYELGWAKDDPLFRIAMALLSDKDNREAWMTIPPEFAVDWVKTVGDKQGYK